MPPLYARYSCQIWLRMIVEKALEKDPGERYQTMRELVIDLRRLARQRTVGETSGGLQLEPALWLRASPEAIRPRPTRPLPVLENPLANAQFTRFTDFSGSEQDAAISPDGRFVAFLSDRDGAFDAWVSQRQALGVSLISRKVGSTNCATPFSGSRFFG